jgi:small-conductance mechanosensitive channel
MTTDPSTRISLFPMPRKGEPTLTQQKQHQQSLENAIQNAHHALNSSQDAEQAVEQAMTSSDPQQMQRARQIVGQANRAVYDAEERLRAEANESQEQQTVQVLEQLEQAKQDLSEASERTEQPKQMR